MKPRILILVISAVMTMGARGQDRLEWSETRKLTVNDFKGTPPDPSTKQTLIANIGLEVNLNPSELKNLKTFNRQVTNLFSPANSWIDWREKSRLRYAITLFDLNEWKAREIRKKLNENRESVLAGQYQEIHEKMNSEFARIREEYDNESDFGNNLMGQMNWETRINERLVALADFCKACDSAKK